MYYQENGNIMSEKFLKYIWKIAMVELTI